MNEEYKITVFTPTFNRAHTLKRLYDSLLVQGDASDFEWLVIDDCSTDNTENLVGQFIKENKININYIKLAKNGGKPRAINIAVDAARSPYLFIVDSDDFLTQGILPKLTEAIQKVDTISNINGIGVLQGHANGDCFAQPKFDKFIDATNLQRREFGLDVDCNEAYKISVLKKYPFEVWPGEIFTPEATVLNAMALDGYKIRWLNEIGVISEYQEDGMTKGAWNLQRRNPMGYAMLFNSNLRHQKGFVLRFHTAMQLTVQTLLGKNLKYLTQSNAPLLTILSLPIAVVVYFRRLWQYHSA